MKTPEVALGLDVGGTKLAGVLLARDGQIIDKKAAHTHAEQGSEAVLRRLCELADRLLQMAPGPVRGIGLATPGIVDSRYGLIRFVSTELPGWAEAPVVRTLSERFGIPVVAENDGRAAALAEYRLGAGRGVDHFVTLVLGTGIGGGIIANGQMLQGSLGGAGRLGHLSVDPRGPKCTCGNRGCLELYVSGPALARAAERAIARGGSSELNRYRVNGSSGLSGREVVQAARQGDPLALDIVKSGGERLGQALVQIARILDPERVAIGGSVAAADELLLKPARDYMQEHCPPQLGQTVQVVKAQFGRDASVVGAALIGWQIAQGQNAARVEG